MGAALPETRQRAVEAIERHIIAVKLGKIRLGWPHDLIEQYLAEEYHRLRIVKACG